MDNAGFKKYLECKPIDKLISIKQRKESDIKEASTFLDWYKDSIRTGNVTKKSIVEEHYKYKVFEGCWMSHRIRTCKKNEIPEVISRFEYEIEKWIEELSIIIEVLKEREINDSKIKLRKEVADKLLNKLEKFCNKNENFFSRRELDCLIALIEDGTINTSKELEKYGVTE